MALKATLDSLDNVDEGLKPFYAQQGDVFVLQVEGVRDHPEVTNLANAYQAEKQKRQAQGEELQAAKAKLAGLPEDFDPEQWKRLKEGKNTPDDVLQLRKTLEAERDEALGKLKEAKGTIYKLTVESEIDRVLAENGVADPTFIKAARALLQPQIKDGDDGRPIVETDMGPLSIADYVPRWVSGEGKAFVAPAKGGGAGGSLTPTGKKFSELTEEERVSLYRESPEKFRRLQAAG